MIEIVIYKEGNYGVKLGEADVHVIKRVMDGYKLPHNQAFATIISAGMQTMHARLMAMLSATERNERRKRGES